MTNLNDNLRNFEQGFLKRRPMSKVVVYTTLNLFLKITSFCNVILELYGAKGLGKTTTLYKLIADLQKQDHLCMMINADFSYDCEYAENCNIDNSKLILANTNKVEEIIEIISGISNCYIFIDSIAGLELTKENIDKLISVIRHNHFGLIYTNQLRTKKDRVSSYGRKTLKLYTDKRICVTKQGLQIKKQ